MNGYGSHTFQWVNAAGERHWVKFHFKTDQGVCCLTEAEAVRAAGVNQAHHQQDLYEAIGRGDYPSWTLKVQLMPETDAADYHINPFDLTKVWPHSDYPLIEVGRMELNRIPDNYFADVEQAAFDPGHMVPGVGPSPDKMLQARLFAYGDAHRYRLGVNHTQLPVNSPPRAAHSITAATTDGTEPCASTPTEAAASTTSPTASGARRRPMSPCTQASISARSPVPTSRTCEASTTSSRPATSTG